MTEQTTFTEADRTDGVEPDMVDQKHAPKSVAPTSGVQPMNMIQALNSALDVKMAEDGNVLSFGDRKSTRLNSSNVLISYPVLCLKKKHIQ